MSRSSERRRIHLYPQTATPYGVIVDGLPRDLTSFRPDLRSFMKVGKMYEAEIEYEGERPQIIRRIKINSKVFTNIR